MKLLDIKSINDINKGDDLLLKGREPKIYKVTVQDVKTENGRTEIIYNKNLNGYFNLSMYFEGFSWVKECKKIV